MNRTETLNLFLSHAPALHIALLRVYSSYCLEVEITGQPYRALVLARSRDFWLQRIHLHRTRPTLVICYQHDTCLPCAALALDQLPRSTRYRYLARMKAFMQNRAGRPLVA